MLQRFVDSVLAVTKESVKTFTFESLNNVAKLINGVSAVVLTLLPGKTSILEGIHGWELRPTLRAPRLPRWMENGVSSFNELIHELSADSENLSSVDSEYSDEDDEEIYPASPLSQASRLSHMSSFSRYDRHLTRWIKFLLYLVLWPAVFLLKLPLVIFQALGFRRNTRTFTAELTGGQILSAHRRRVSGNLKDHVVQTTDRRRGVVEDLQLAIEIFIESVFETVHKTVHFLLSPSQILRKLFGWISPSTDAEQDSDSSDPDIPIPTDTLGDADPTPTERRDTLHQSYNTDARTCQDVITELGYPYEAVHVVTADGYVLLLERIPRRDSKKVVYLQHGIMDSSMGWVSNGVVGSPAFAAYDQGYDVFLGNLRGLVSREHIDKNISSRKYWRYSINEHGTKDVPAMIEKINEIKTLELEKFQTDLSGENSDQPYKICALSHSLGGAVMLMYVITSRLNAKPHRLSRMILLSPAGFHEDSSIVFTIVEKLVLLLGPMLAPVFPGLYIPTRFFRMLVNKLARDFHNYPALGGLVQTLMSYVVGGDSSNWVGVLGLSHYNIYDMPGVSFHVALHLAQIKHARKFQMYDYRSAAANLEAYGTSEPLDLGEHYSLIDIPVDLVAGKKDKVIRPSMVRKHYKLMKRGGVEVTFSEYEYAHLDFTFSHREELLGYVMSRLQLLVAPAAPKKCISSSQSTVRNRKHNRTHLAINGNDVYAEKGVAEEEDCT